MRPSSLSSAKVGRQSDVSAKANFTVSIIVPMLDETDRTRPFLEHLRERAPCAELIVVNAAGSRGISPSAVEICDRVLSALRVRAAQMNAGASMEGGGIFWLGPADSEG